MNVVLHYKKPDFWIILFSLILCFTVIICFFTNPKREELSVADEIRIISDSKEVLQEYICEQIGFAGRFTLTLYENGTFSYYEGAASSYFGDGNWGFEDGKRFLFDKGTGKIRKVVLEYEEEDEYMAQADFGNKVSEYLKEANLLISTIGGVISYK